MILATRSGNRELRFGESLARIPSWGSLGTSAAGQNVTTESALTLAVLGRAVRLVSGIAASLPIRVFQGRKGDRQERPDTPQGILLNQPHYGVSAYDWRYDIFSSLEAVENAFMMKRKDNAGRVVELEVIPHYAVIGRIDKRTGQKLFDVQTVDGKKTYTTSDVLHVRGQTVGGGPFGVSRITQHRDPIGSMLAAQRFEGTYLRKHARPDIAVVFPQGVTRDQAKEWKPEWEEQYGGPEGAGGVFPMGGGADIKPIPLSLRDAQFIEARNLSIEDGGRIMDLDPLLLGAVSAGSRPDRAAALEHFLHVDLPPRLRRVEAALAADPDIFPAGAGLYPQSEVDELMFAEPLKRAQVQHFRIQDGTELVDEARADNGRGPLPPIPTDPTQEPGKVPQITPVGGAPTLPVGSPEPAPARALERQREVVVVNLPAAMDTDEIAAGLRELAAAQRHQDPQVIHVQAPDVTVQPADVHIEPAVVNVTPEIALTVPKRSVVIQRDDGTSTSYTETEGD